MTDTGNINITARRKAKLDPETRAAIAKAVRYIRCDRKVAQYIAGPHEGISPDDVAAVRRAEISNGRARA